MKLTREDRISLGTASRDEVLGSDLAQKTASKDAKRKWEAVQEEVRYLLSVENDSRVLSSVAERLLKNEVVKQPWELMSHRANDAAAYGAAHPFDNPCVADPLQGLQHIPDILAALAETMPLHFAKNKRQAQRNALTAWHYYCKGTPLPTDEPPLEDFDSKFGHHFKDERRNMLLQIAMDCRTYQALARTRINFLYKQLRWEAELMCEQAQTAKVQAELYEAQKRPDKVAAATAAATTRQADADDLKRILESLTRMESNQSDTNQRLAAVQAMGARVEGSVEAIGVSANRHWKQFEGMSDWPGKSEKKKRMDYSPMWSMVDKLRAEGKSVEVACSEALTCFEGKNADETTHSNFVRACYKRDEKQKKLE